MLHNILPFGAHSISVKNYKTGVPLYMAELLNQVNLSENEEAVKIKGGAHLSNVAVFTSNRDQEIVVTFKEYPAPLLEVLRGSAFTRETPQSAAAIKDERKVKGAWTGATLALTSQAGTLVIPGSYTIVAKTANSVDVYVNSRAYGVQSFVDRETGLIAQDLGVTDSSTTQLPGGAELVLAGASAIAEGDVLEYRIAGPHDGAFDQLNTGNIPSKEVDITCVADEGNVRKEMRFFRCKPTSGLNESMVRKESGEFEITFALIYDQVKEGLFQHWAEKRV